MLQYNEEQRLAMLARSRLSAARSDHLFDRVVHFVQETFRVSMVAISIIERDEQVFFATCGLVPGSIGRDVAFCSQVMATNGTVVILDASLEPRWANNPLVVSGPEVRFYAGVPLRFDGHIVGTLCILDEAPRNRFSVEDAGRLERIGDLVTDLVELRALREERKSRHARFDCMAETSPDAMIVADESGRILFWNGAAETLFGYDAASATSLVVNDLLPPRLHHRPGEFAAMFDGSVGVTRELQAVAKDGRPLGVELSLSRWREDGQTIYGAVIRDVSERQETASKLHRLAHHDALTELPNRTVVMARLKRALAGRASTGILLVDLDGFKEVNDRLGHAAGDEVLKVATSRLLDCVTPTDTVARLGGDEFVVLIEGCADPIRLGGLADGIISRMGEPFSVADQEMNLSASIGIALAPTHADTADELLSLADLALYRAKADGRHCYRIFSPVLRAAASERRRYVQDLRRALEGGEFRLHYQPQVSLADGRLLGAEALIRWQHPEAGFLSPAGFLPSIENSRYVVDIGDWVMETACRQAARWRAMGHDSFRIAVNTFGAQFRGGDFAEKTFRILDAAGLPPRNLEVEITENTILAHDETIVAPLRALQDAGIAVAFDDYGTGYASLSLLKRFPLTRLKIDQSFVREMNEVADVAIIRAILDLARAFRLEVIAEGVETRDQVARLRRKGCREGQGYLFGKPMPADEFERLLLGGSDLLAATVAA